MVTEYLQHIRKGFYTSLDEVSSPGQFEKAILRTGAQMSKATLIATLMAVASAFSSPAKAQAPLKTKPSAKSDQPTYMITAHTVVHDDSTIQRDNYVIVYGSEVLRVQYADSQISNAKPGASQLEHEEDIQIHAWYSSGPFGPDLSEVPQVGVAIRACEMEMDAAYPGGYRMAAIQSVSAPCMVRYGNTNTLIYVLAPNGGVKMYDQVAFDISEETNNLGVVPAQSVPPRKDIPAIAKAANGAIVTVVTASGDKPIAQGTGFLFSADGGDYDELPRH